MDGYRASKRELKSTNDMGIPAETIASGSQIQRVNVGNYLWFSVKLAVPISKKI